MDRRTFMKGAVVAASTPVAALAPAAVVVGLGSVAAQFSEIKSLYQAALDRVERISELPSNPGFPTVTSADLPRIMVIPGQNYEMHSRSAIEFFFEKRERTTEASRKMMGDRWADSHLANYRKVKAGVVEVFEGRKAKRDLWEIETGWKAACREADRLADLMNDLDDRILYGQCETLDDVRIKARHISSEYIGELSTDAMFKVIESLAGRAA